MNTSQQLHAHRLTMTVVICAYTLDRWSQLEAAVRSAQTQRQPVQEIVVVIDHNPELFERARRRWTADAQGDAGLHDLDASVAVQVVASTGAPGLSGARNTGVVAAHGDIVAFLDDDARAHRSWSEQLLRAYADPGVVACGGTAQPALAGARPTWWPREFDWVVGCSYVGLPVTPGPVRNLIGANMSARRAAVVEVGGFPEDIGRLGTRPLGCEETDLFIRIGQRRPADRIVYEPAARVDHDVPPARLSWRYFRARCLAEGLSKAKVAGRVGSDRALASERSYVIRVLPLGVVRGLLGACRGEEGAGRRALAIGAGLALTTTGYVGGRLTGSFKALSAPRRSVRMPARVHWRVAP